MEDDPVPPLNVPKQRTTVGLGYDSEKQILNEEKKNNIHRRLIGALCKDRAQNLAPLRWNTSCAIDLPKTAYLDQKDNDLYTLRIPL